MQIILQEDVEKLGNRGEWWKSPKATREIFFSHESSHVATPGNMKQLERMRVVFAKREATEKGDAEKQAEVLNGVSLAIARKAGENDQLFGSVTTADISEALAAQGFTIDRRKIQLVDPIKLIGEYKCP